MKAAVLSVLVLMATISFLSSIHSLDFFGDNLPPNLLAFFSKHAIRFGGTGFFSYFFSFHPDYVIHKLGHITLFGLLGAFLYRATSRSVPVSMAVAVVFSVIDELHQGFVPGRSSQFGDVILDTLSAAAFICFAWYRNRKNNGENSQAGDDNELYYKRK